MRLPHIRFSQRREPTLAHRHLVNRGLFESMTRLPTDLDSRSTKNAQFPRQQKPRNQAIEKANPGLLNGDTLLIESS